MTKRFSNSLTGCLLAAAAILASVATGSAHNPGAKPPHSESGGDHGNPGVIPPNASFGGHTYAEWSEKWWLWSFSLPADQNPTVTFTAPCTNGQSGHTWFIYGGPPTVNCTVPPGTSFVLPVANTECSSLEPAPFHGDNAAPRQACAKAWIDNLTGLFASIDCETIQHLNLYRVQSGDFHFTVPANNILGAPAGASGSSSADGYYLVIPPLSAGTHTLRVKGTFHDPFDPTHPVVFPLDTTITLTVGR